MTSLKISWTITAVLALMLAFVGFKFVTGSVEETDDGRTAIIMTTPERDLVLGEMRTFLEGVQTIIEAIAADDMGTHKAFDDLSMEATDMGNGDIVLAQLGELMLRCTSCHEAYRFDVAAEEN